MRFTSKCILLAIALAYGGTAVSAAPVGKSSLAARSAEYELASEDINHDAREIDDLELFVREPLSIFGFNTPSSATPSQTGGGLPSKLVKTVTDHVKSKYSGAPSQTVGSNTGASLTSKMFGTISDHMKSKTSKTSGPPEVSSPPKKTDKPGKKPVVSEKVKKQSEAAHTGKKKPTPNQGAQTPKKQKKGYKKDINKAANDKNHPLYNTAIALQDARIRKAQDNNPRLVKAALANPKHDLHKAAIRVKKAQAAENNFNALPYGSVPESTRPTTSMHGPPPPKPHGRPTVIQLPGRISASMRKEMDAGTFSYTPTQLPQIPSPHLGPLPPGLSSTQSVTIEQPGLGHVPASSLRPKLNAYAHTSSATFPQSSNPWQPPAKRFQFPDGTGDSYGSANIQQSVHIYQ